MNARSVRRQVRHNSLFAAFSTRALYLVPTRRLWVTNDGLSVVHGFICPFSGGAQEGYAFRAKCATHRHRRLCEDSPRKTALVYLLLSRLLLSPTSLSQIRPDKTSWLLRVGPCSGRLQCPSSDGRIHIDLCGVFGHLDIFCCVLTSHI